jgi:hypothetical protein
MSADPIAKTPLVVVEPDVPPLYQSQGNPMRKMLSHTAAVADR